MLAALLLLAAAPAAAPVPLPAFMAGCWDGRAGERWSQECWMEPRGGVMLGAARAGKGDTLDMWEWNRIDRAADGTVTFWAAPRGRSATAFKRASGSATEIVFTNPANDYPQRIRYWRDGEMLYADISLLDGSKPMRYSYRREATPRAK